MTGVRITTIVDSMQNISYCVMLIITTMMSTIQVMTR